MYRAVRLLHCRSLIVATGVAASLLLAACADGSQRPPSDTQPTATIGPTSAAETSPASGLAIDLIWTVDLDGLPDGPWAQQGESGLSRIACASTARCWAFGAALTEEGGHGYIAVERTGAGWELAAWLESEPTAGAPAANLPWDYIECGQQDLCWGTTTHVHSEFDWSTVFVTYDGTEWTERAGFETEEGAALSAVSCVKSSCVAVGGGVGGGYRPVVARLDGGDWRTLTAGPADSSGTLHDIACIDVDFCWGVGTSDRGVDRIAIAMITGDSWDWVSGESFPSGGVGTPTLRAVACTDQGTCWAAGSWVTTSGQEDPFLMHYSGNTWALYGDSPLPVQTLGCAKATRCWATGITSSGPRAAQWDGEAWTLVSPEVGGAPSVERIMGMDCPSADVCFAVANNPDAFGTSSSGAIIYRATG